MQSPGHQLRNVDAPGEPATRLARLSRWQPRRLRCLRWTWHGLLPFRTGLYTTPHPFPHTHAIALNPTSVGRACPHTTPPPTGPWRVRRQGMWFFAHLHPLLPHCYISTAYAFLPSLWDLLHTTPSLPLPLHYTHTAAIATYLPD